MKNFPRFGTAGIRAITPTEFSSRFALFIGMAAHYLGESFAVGRDIRTAADMVKDGFIAGVRAVGKEVHDLGIVPLPVLVFGQVYKKLDVGAMITASHNPPEYIGIKLFDRKGVELGKEDEKRIEDIIEREDFSLVEWNSVGDLYYDDIVDAYIHAYGDIPEGELNVVVDCVNGTAGRIVSRLYSPMTKMVVLNGQEDGYFPAHLPEPGPENLVETMRFVRAGKFDGGLAFDGDADRIAVIDENGNFISQSRVLALAAAISITTEKRLVISTVDTSMCLDEVVKEKGGRLIRTPIGKTHHYYHKYWNNIAMAGEPWKIAFSDWPVLVFDGIQSGYRFLKLMLDKNTKMSGLFKDISDYPSIRLSFEITPEEKKNFVENYEREMDVEFPDYDEKWTIDGVRVNFSDGWVLLRPSGTEPKIRIYAEAFTQQRLEELVSRAKKAMFRAMSG